MSVIKEGELVVAIMDLQNRLQHKLSRTLSSHGIGLSEYLVLSQLVKEGNNTMRRSDLADKVGLTPSGVTRLLNPLEKIGIVKKQSNPRDARVSLVTLTKTGLQVYTDAQVGFNSSSIDLFKNLNKPQLNALAELVDLARR